eukprot:CAMPEP_0172604006 /NCGR_PEP_ID=MMETSP1068-20121228/24242_1 /TAXON_ID=35684 /ORGANISM="Pseudopedinella elastica, Strain CCMP716" /LENGTH=554 /DNA_ID=CAMNT_0013405925 /DNA_START=61 /DNA_END=1725 /DNA_ORIENTATION=+
MATKLFRPAWGTQFMTKGPAPPANVTPDRVVSGFDIDDHILASLTQGPQEAKAPRLSQKRSGDGGVSGGVEPALKRAAIIPDQQVSGASEPLTEKTLDASAWSKLAYAQQWANFAQHIPSPVGSRTVPQMGPEPAPPLPGAWQQAMRQQIQQQVQQQVQQVMQQMGAVPSLWGLVPGFFAPHMLQPTVFPHANWPGLEHHPRAAAGKGTINPPVQWAATAGAEAPVTFSANNTAFSTTTGASSTGAVSPWGLGLYGNSGPPKSIELQPGEETKSNDEPNDEPFEVLASEPALEAPFPGDDDLLPLEWLASLDLINTADDSSSNNANGKLRSSSLERLGSLGPYPSAPLPAGADSCFDSKGGVELWNPSGPLVSKTVNKSAKKAAGMGGPQTVPKGGSPLCTHPGCSKISQGTQGLCIAHGGGRRCTALGCTRGARDKNFCAAHGGGKRCLVGGCTKSAVGALQRCTKHGGGRRCQAGGCTKSAQSATPHCVKHGGGRKCAVGGCAKVARGRTQHCAAHGGGIRCTEPTCNRAALGRTDMTCRRHTAQRAAAAAN